MYKKHIGHFIMVSLKYFFDFDYSFCSHAVLIVLVIAGIIKLFAVQTASIFYEGVLTVKEDALMIKEEVRNIKERWYNSNSREVIINIYLSIKGLSQTKYQ